ncbi:hypothetical protein PVAP13_9KG294413 [Panicum virgatum]|uniref:Uncharacterized protein n=1 Tax=Panicum virgatum TaxID=38727 RepID=A0A8T0NPF5_PANVG|nr:hypothetical protein PVAP13_9KG294413 [Panicum virgatum]
MAQIRELYSLAPSYNYTTATSTQKPMCDLMLYCTKDQVNLRHSRISINIPSEQYPRNTATRLHWTNASCHNLTNTIHSYTQ